jgi:hypothetical protein
MTLFDVDVATLDRIIDALRPRIPDEVDVQTMTPQDLMKYITDDQNHADDHMLNLWLDSKEWQINTRAAMTAAQQAMYMNDMNALCSAFVSNGSDMFRAGWAACEAMRQDEAVRRNREAFILAAMLADISAQLGTCEMELRLMTSAPNVTAEVRSESDQMAEIGAGLQKARSRKEVIETALRRCLQVAVDE